MIVIDLFVFQGQLQAQFLPGLYLPFVLILYDCLCFYVIMANK